MTSANFERENTENTRTDASIDAPEPIQIVGRTMPRKTQHADDVVLTQCILCVVLVLVCVSLHWLKPEWQAELLGWYRALREASPVTWLDHFLNAVQAWLQT